MVAVIAPDPPLWLQNGAYAARLDRQLIALVSPEGIFRGLAVTPHTPAPDFTVHVTKGMAVIAGDDETDQGSYLALLGNDVDLAVDPPGGQNRIDRVVIRVNDSQAGGATGDNATADIVKGTPTAGVAAVPALPPSAVELMRVTLAGNTTAIAAAQLSGVGRTFGRSVGVVEVFAGPSRPAWGLFCDGAAVSRLTYADLFSVIGTSWGAGDGLNTFNVPNLKGRTLTGLDSADTLFSAVGKIGGSKNAVVVAHTHSITHDHPQATTSVAGNHTHTVDRKSNAGTSTGLSSGAVAQAGDQTTSAAGNHSHTLNVPNFIGNTGGATGGVSGTNANLPPFGTCNFVIRI